ncbi:MAG: hypothetical protein Q9160_002702 [Pyrenula sp. 1 TL-2023]
MSIAAERVHHNQLTARPEYSILLLGLDNAGKTTLLSQIKSLFSTDAPSSTAGNTVPTVGQNVATVTLPDMYLKIWDVGGQMSLRNLWQSYYKSAHAIVFVIDSSDVGGDADLSKILPDRRKSSQAVLEDDPVGSPSLSSAFTDMDERGQGRLDECRQVLESVLQHEDTTGIPVLVLANKQDREDCVEVVRIKEGFVRKVFEGGKGSQVRDSRVLPVSALQGTGVKEAVDWSENRYESWSYVDDPLESIHLRKDFRTPRDELLARRRLRLRTKRKIWYQVARSCNFHDFKLQNKTRLARKPNRVKGTMPKWEKRHRRKCGRKDMDEYDTSGKTSLNSASKSPLAERGAQKDSEKLHNNLEAEGIDYWSDSRPGKNDTFTTLNSLVNEMDKETGLEEGREMMSVLIAWKALQVSRYL